MSTQAYATKPPPAPAQDAVMRTIRSAMVARGTSFREWARAWAIRNGRDPDATYETARITVMRRLRFRKEPKGVIGAAIMRDLRAELGASVVPLPNPRRRAAGIPRGLTDD